MNAHSPEVTLEPVVDGDVAPCPPAATPSHPIRGILLFAAGVLVLACMDTTTKYLVARYQLPTILAIRYLVNCLLMAAIFGPIYGLGLVQTHRRGLVILRASCLAAASIFAGLAFRRMPVAETTSIVFLAPTLVLLAAKPLLGEAIGALGWLAALAGFGGVILVAHPGGGLEPLGVGLALATAAVTAVYQLLSRLLASSERTITLLFYTALVGSVVFGITAPFLWDGRFPKPSHLALMFSLGIYSGLGHYLFTAAHRYAGASTLAPIGYLQVVWAGLLGWAVFQHVPDGPTILGMVVIMCSGVLIVLKPWLLRKR